MRNAMRQRMIQRVGLWTAGAALAATGVIALNATGGPVMIAGAHPVPLAPTTSTAPSVAPTHPVDCNDPNNSVNCQTPPIDSPLVVGTAEPGSPFRD